MPTFQDQEDKLFDEKFTPLKDVTRFNDEHTREEYCPSKRDFKIKLFLHESHKRLIENLVKRFKEECDKNLAKYGGVFVDYTFEHIIKSSLN